MIAKRISATLAALALMLSLVACGGNSEEPEVLEQSESYEESRQTEEPEPELSVRGTMLSLTPDSQLEITRNFDDVQEKAAPTDGIWTIFVYMCGSDLESKHSSATDDLSEMLDAAEKCPNLRFVVLAGGASKWHTEQCVDGENKVLLINSEGISQLGGLSGSMGDPDTLYGFLTWGLENYDSQYIMLDFWDHGGGSGNGVCFDECHMENGYKDYLSLAEIDHALAAVYQRQGRRFEMIGCDACLMATIELANLCVPYADYLLASQESEPGSGWDYHGFAEAVSAGCTDGATLGRILCDVYYSSFDGWNGQRNTTLSVVDLSKIDALLIDFNEYCSALYRQVCQRENGVDAVLYFAGRTENFGSNSKSEGYTNMVDMGDFVRTMSGEDGQSGKVLSAVSDCIVYMKNGADKSRAGGLSIYYPLSLQGSSSARYLKDICVTPFYMAIVDICAYSCANMGSISGYDTQQWLGGDSDYWSGEETTDGNYDHWDGDDSDTLNTDTGNSAVRFEEAPHIWQYVDPDEEQYSDFLSGIASLFGTEYDETREAYTFVVTEDTADKVLDVFYNNFFTYQWEENNRIYYADLGQMDNVQRGVPAPDERRYNSILETVWYGLPNNALLCAYPIGKNTDETLGEYMLYTSPVQLNGENRNLQFIRVRGSSYWEYYMLGTYESVSGEGAAGRIEPLKEGDEITPRYPAYDSETFEYVFDLVGAAYTVPADGTQKMKWNAFLPDGDYLYSFDIVDIYGQELFTDFVTYRIDHKGVNGDSRVYFVY